jgi:nicotinamidase-related amidase
MARKNRDLHGNAPDRGAVALILIDVINDLEFREGADMEAHARPMAEHLVALKRRAREAGIPCVYANDNFGRWRSDFTAIVEHCLHDGVRGRFLAEALAPDPDDYFVLKPKHSAFFSTTLDLLLDYLGSHTLILAGMAANLCVLFTAFDAHQRDFHLHVPSDCVASNTIEDTRQALGQMARIGIDTRPSDELDLARLVSGRHGSRGDI